MNVNLHIERIVLDGIDLSLREQPMLQTAIQSELTRLLVTYGLSAGNESQAYIAAKPIRLVQPIEPGQLGRQIAAATYGGLHT